MRSGKAELALHGSSLKAESNNGTVRSGASERRVSGKVRVRFYPQVGVGAMEVALISDDE
eukprot:2852268-Pyramimonas_sp.AAC.1